VFRNLVKGMELVRPNQVWAADITCIRTDEGFLYLSLLMDLWPGKTAGFHAGDTLEAEGAVRALEMALKEPPKEAFPVHHSDCGCQYCPHRYVGKLTGRGLPVSMTEEARCYENARAERDIETGIRPRLPVSDQKAGACGDWRGGVFVQHQAASSGAQL
jgi:transposase InsO family protein